jgi:hypothetical protein
VDPPCADRAPQKLANTRKHKAFKDCHGKIQDRQFRKSKVVTGSQAGSQGSSWVCTWVERRGESSSMARGLCSAYCEGVVASVSVSEARALACLTWGAMGGCKSVLSRDASVQAFSMECRHLAWLELPLLSQQQREAHPICIVIMHIIV